MLYKFLYFVLSYDIWFYFSHMFLHTNFMYMFIHRRHHEVDHKTLRYTDTYIAHIIEAPFQCVGLFLPLVTTKLDYRLLAYVFAFLQIRGLLRHDTRMAWLVGNHHILHHESPKYNFGDLWLDWLMGTRYPNWDRYKFGLIYN